jgi:quercetin dioxygenase-like cupin family protein
MSLEVHAREKTEGRAVWFLNQLAIVKATAKQTGNGFCLIEMVTPPGEGSPYHVHRNEDETFYVLEGRMQFISGKQRIVGEAGAYVFLPRDIPHGFRVLGNSPARYLILCTPGGFEGFVLELGEPASTLTLPTPSAPDMNKLMALAAKYGVEILGPLPD